jgi:integrase
VLAAGTGLRQGECFGLSVDRVDFLHHQVRVNRQLLGAKGGVPEFGPPKSKAGFRNVPLPDVVSTVLAEHLARYRRGSSDLIFTSSYGTPLRRNTAGEMWHRAARKAELPEWATFHDLRHFYASLLISRGCSVKTVQRRLGHQSAMEIFVTGVLIHPHRAATWEFSGVHHERPLDSVTPGDQIKATPGVPACGRRRQRGGRLSRPTPVRDT